MDGRSVKPASIAARSRRRRRYGSAAQNYPLGRGTGTGGHREAVTQRRDIERDAGSQKDVGAQSNCLWAGRKHPLWLACRGAATAIGPPWRHFHKLSNLNELLGSTPLNAPLRRVKPSAFLMPSIKMKKTLSETPTPWDASL